MTFGTGTEKDIQTHLLKLFQLLLIFFEKRYQRTNI